MCAAVSAKSQTRSPPVHTGLESLQSDSSEEKEEGERKKLCSRLLLRTVIDLTVQSLRTALYLSPTASFQAGNPGTREQHQTENPGLEDNMANHSGL